MTFFTNALVSFFFGLIGAMTFFIGHSYLYDRPIATVEIDTLISEHLSSVAGLESIDEATQERMVADYAQTIDTTIRAISDTQRVTLLVKPAVLTDAPDYTALVRDALQQVGSNAHQ